MKKLLLSTAAVALLSSPALAASALGTGDGPSVKACNQLVVTTGAGYGTNFVVGGVQQFSNMFATIGSGVLQSVTVTIADNETGGFTFFPFMSAPGATSTLKDNTLAAIAAIDVPKTGAPINLTANSQLASSGFTVLYGYGIGSAIAPGQNLFGVLLANATLSTNFNAATDVQVCIGVLQDR